MEVMTDVPLDPQPIRPILTAEFALDPKAVFGLINVTADNAAVLCKNFLLFIYLILIEYLQQVPIPMRYPPRQFVLLCKL